jgi:hypothetical protein
MAERTRPGYCAPCYLDARRVKPADTIWKGTAFCWKCLLAGTAPKAVDPWTN